MLRPIHFVIFFILAAPLALAGETVPWETTLSTGIAYRQQGKLQLSIDLLEQAMEQASTDDNRMRAMGELGASQLQARRLDQAELSLHKAYAYYSGTERARYALDLGNLAVIRKRQKDAQGYYEESLHLADGNTAIHVIAGLDLARITSEPERLDKLKPLFQEIGRIDDLSTRARVYLNLGDQAGKLGKPALELAYRSIDLSRQILAKQTIADNRLQAEALDAMAQLYEDQGRSGDALTLTQQAIERSHALGPGVVGDLLINLEWRQGRLQRALKQPVLALAAYQRAVDQIESIRQDIPIDSDDGRSSFNSTLEPIYLGLTDLLLQDAGQQSGEGQALSLRHAAETVELIKQSEMQDYLGDRCTVDAVKGGTATVIPSNTAILYPIIFDDRVELLLKTGSSVVRFSTKISGETVRQTAARFANDLRNGLDGYLAPSQQLYDWIFRPIETFIADEHINTLVVVPDSSLRLVAMSALHDGKQFAIEKFAVSTVTGLSMTNTNAPQSLKVESLIAGASEFGPVVEKLARSSSVEATPAENSKDQTSRKLTPNRNVRAIRGFSIKSIADDQPDQQPGNRNAMSRANTDALRKSLELPGVADEIREVSSILPGSTAMFNAAFTVNAFSRNAESGSYRVLHIATHGVFGGSGDTSFILAYDDVLTLNGLQSLLRSDRYQKNPIELMTLSACETAEGNDRSPLGIAGASIKAHAKSVVGTLWPVDDVAARKVMEKFYTGIMNEHLTKTEALRRAQIELIHIEEFSHPSFWAPFDLIGNWL